MASAGCPPPPVVPVVAQENVPSMFRDAPHALHCADDGSASGMPSAFRPVSRTRRRRRQQIGAAIRPKAQHQIASRAAADDEHALQCEPLPPTSCAAPNRASRTHHGGASKDCPS